MCKGEAGKEHMRRIADTCLKFADGHAPSESESDGEGDSGDVYDEDINITLDACKAIRLVLQVETPGSTETALATSDVLDEMRRSRNFRGQRLRQAPLALLANAIEEDASFYQGRLAIVD